MPIENLENYVEQLKKSNNITDEVAEAILKYKSLDVTSENPPFKTALDCAIENSNLALFKELIENGATEFNPINLIDIVKEGKNDFLQFILDKKLLKDANDKQVYSLLFPAIGWKNQIMVKALLDYGIDPKVKLGDASALQTALRTGNTEAAQYLLEAMSDEDIMEKDAEGRNLLHIILKGWDNQHIKDFLKIALDDPRTHKLINQPDFYRKSPLFEAVSAKKDDIIKILWQDDTIDVTDINYYGMHFPNVSQINLNNKLAQFLKLTSEMDPDEIIDKDGTCNGWGFWHDVEYAHGNAEEFQTIRELIVAWNGTFEPSNDRSGLSTALKDIEFLPQSLKDKFPPIKDENGTREATVADLFTYVCNTLAFFQQSQQLPIKDLYIGLTQFNRDKQYNKFMKSGNKKVTPLFASVSRNLSEESLTELFAYWQQFPNTSFDIKLLADEGGHQVSVFVDDQNQLHYLDSNLPHETTPFKNPNELAKFVSKATIGYLIPILKKIDLFYGAYHFHPENKPAIKPKPPKGYSKLHWAIMQNDVTQLKALLKIPAMRKELDIPDGNGITPMNLALKLAYHDCIESILMAENGLKKPFIHSNLINFDSLGKYEKINLFNHMQNKNLDKQFTDINGKKITDELLNIEEYNKSSILPLYQSIESGFFYPFQYFLQEAGNKIDFNEFLWNPNTARRITQLVIWDMEKPNFADIHGTTPLMLAAQYQMIDELEILVRKPGVDINKADKAGNTALMWAIKTNNLKAVKILKNAGALIEPAVGLALANNRPEYLKALNLIAMLTQKTKPISENKPSVKALTEKYDIVKKPKPKQALKNIMVNQPKSILVEKGQAKKPTVKQLREKYEGVPKPPKSKK